MAKSQREFLPGGVCELHGAGGWLFLWILILPVPLQVLQLRPRAKRLPEAGAGSGCRVQGRLRVPGGGREAAAQGTAPLPGGRPAGLRGCSASARGRPRLPGLIPHPGPAFPIPPQQMGRREGMRAHLVSGGRRRERRVRLPPLPGAGARDGRGAAALPSMGALPQIRPGQWDRHQSSQLVLKSGSALALLRREGLGVGARGMRCMALLIKLTLKPLHSLSPHEE